MMSCHAKALRGNVEIFGVLFRIVLRSTPWYHPFSALGLRYIFQLHQKCPNFTTLMIELSLVKHWWLTSNFNLIWFRCRICSTQNPIALSVHLLNLLTPPPALIDRRDAQYAPPPNPPNDTTQGWIETHITIQYRCELDGRRGWHRVRPSVTARHFFWSNRCCMHGHGPLV